MHSSHDSNSVTKSRQKNDVLGSGKFEDPSLKLLSYDEVNLAENQFDYIGKIPEPVSGSEPLGLGPREILRSVNFKLPVNATPRDEYDTEEPSDINSVFQEHLDNMFKTIKRAKASNKRKVPELRGLEPKIIPQVLLENTDQQESVASIENIQTEEPTTDLHPDFLNVRRNLPKNSPPPTATKQTSEDETKTEGNPKMNGNISGHIISVVAPADVKLVTEGQESKTSKNKTQAQPKTPHSVQSNRSVKLLVPTVEDASNPFVNNSEVRILTASVDLIVPSVDDDEGDGAATDRSRLEVTITSMPVAPPASIATSADDSIEDDDES